MFPSEYRLVIFISTKNGSEEAISWAASVDENWKSAI